MKQKFLASIVMIGALFLLSTSAAAFTHVVAFGDSMTDNGTTSDSHGFGTYTSGSPWADQLAVLHDATLLNVAYGGATTGMGHLYDSPNPIPGTDPARYMTPGGQYGVQWQVGQEDIRTEIGTMTMDSTLFSLFAGPNDYNRMMALAGGSATVEEKQAAAFLALENLSAAAGSLINDLGAKHILIPNLMYLAGDGMFAGTFNFLLPDKLNALRETYTDTTFYTMDMNTLFNDLFDGYDFFSSDPGVVASERYRAWLNGLLWDDYYHPGPTTHTAMALAAYNATVPIPGAFMLLGSGLLALAGISRRKAA